MKELTHVERKWTHMKEEQLSSKYRQDKTAHKAKFWWSIGEHNSSTGTAVILALP